jgi:hypothetical protein
MKLTSKLMTALCAGILLFAACKKDKDDSNNTTPTVTKTKKDYLTDGKWQFTSFSAVARIVDSSMGLDTTITESEFGNSEPCDKDDFMTFGTNGKVYVDEGATKCDPSDVQVDSTSTWSLNSDFTKLTIQDVGSDPQVFDVTELTSSNFVWTTKDEEVDGTMRTTTTITIKAKNIK